MRTLKLQHIRNVTPGFFAASGGWEMATKPFSQKTDSALAASIDACLRFSGGTSEIHHNYRIAKGPRGEYLPVFEEGWRPVRIFATIEGRVLKIEINKKSQPAARTTDKELVLRTPSFETFSAWFISQFPKSHWAQVTAGTTASEIENSSIARHLVKKGPPDHPKRSDFNKSALAV